MLAIQKLWHAALQFVFYYPLFMSYLWMVGALIFYWRERQEPPYQQPEDLPIYPFGYFNDSYFWVVNRTLGVSEAKDQLTIWSVTSTVAWAVGVVEVLILNIFM